MIPTGSEPVRALTGQANPERRRSIADDLPCSAHSRLAGGPPLCVIITHLSIHGLSV
jgi:hypothetical protein